jgi:8-oxo-dGTP diphosphatase
MATSTSTAPTGASIALRAPRESDADDIERYISDAEVARRTANIPHPYPKGGALEWMRAPGETKFVIVRRKDDALVGVIGLRAREAGVSELGYWIGKPFWGRGYATEAARLAIAHGFARLGRRSIFARVTQPDNVASIRVQEKSGMVLAPDGTRRITFEQWCAANPVPTVLVAAAALVDGDGRVLIAQRPQGKSMAGLWEFPGGKVTEGETPEAALIRELKEELDIDTISACLAPFTFASHRYEDFHLLMPLYVCRKWQGELRAVEHAALKWVRPARLGNYEMPPADKPLVAMLRDFL